MTPFDAAKVFLGNLLYINASVLERDKGLYPPNHTEDEFHQAIGVLKGASLPPEDLIDKLPGGYMLYAAISAARRW
ncbi:MAG: hypothetical protein ACWGQW_01770 [bacterium]